MNQPPATLEVKVITGAKKTEICDFLADGSLKIKIHSKPIEGKANQEIIYFLSERLQISRTDIEIVKGEHSKRKVLRFTGIRKTDLLNQLQGLIRV